MGRVTKTYGVYFCMHRCIRKYIPLTTKDGVPVKHCSSKWLTLQRNPWTFSDLV